MATDDGSIAALRLAVEELRRAVDCVKKHKDDWKAVTSMAALPSDASGWNFTTFEKFINQRFNDLSLQLRERYEAQQTGVTAALAAAEKAVNAALIAAEKAVDKAEGAQQLRNEAQNEFRKSLSDLSGLMWTTKEGQAAIDALRREIDLSIKAVQEKTSILESGYANIQGRIWSVSALFAIIALTVSVAVRFFHA
jgi:hypothetical protein